MCIFCNTKKRVKIAIVALLKWQKQHNSYFIFSLQSALQNFTKSVTKFYKKSVIRKNRITELNTKKEKTSYHKKHQTCFFVDLEGGDK